MAKRLKLSDYIERGYEIAKKYGIKQTRDTIFHNKLNGELDSACALGMAYMGKARKPVIDIRIGLPAAGQNEAINYNDTSKYSIPKIIERLRAKGY